MDASASRQFPGWCLRDRDHVRFARFDATYESTLQAGQGFDLSDENVVSAFLQTRLVGTTDPNEQTTIIRAAQAAAFLGGTHIDVDVPGVLRAASMRAATASLTDLQWEDVVSCARPRLPSIVALLAAGIPEDRIRHVPGSAVSDDAGTVTDDDERTYQIPEAARTAIRAQHLLRRSFGVGPDDPFIADSSDLRDRDIRHELNRWAGKINVPMRLRHTQSHNNRWQYRMGVALTDLKRAA